MTITNHDDAMLALGNAQGGDTNAEYDLIEFITRNYMGKRIGRYLNRNRTAENEDLKQEFMIGVAMSIHNARLDLGDPLEYIIKQGVYRVRTFLRQQVIKSTVQRCNECGYITRLNRIEDQYICKRCGCSNVVTHELDDHNEIALDNAADTQIAVEDEIVSEMMIAEFEKTLVEGTNVHSLYMLLKGGINRDNPAIKNYIKEIARIWGGDSEQNVVQTLNKLQARLIKFAEANNMTIKNNQFVEVD